MNHRLALGTVQLGLDYGIANRAGQVTAAEAKAIVDHAWMSGIDTLDTAIAYGESERRLGEIGVGGWKVITKLPAIADSCEDVGGWVRESVKDSLARLGIPRLRGLLLHKPRELLGPKGEALYRALVTLKERGRVERIGISIYGPEELDSLCRHYDFDLIQAPFNVIDRRLATSGWLSRLHKAGTEIHVRSVFLQGLLLMGVNDLPATFKRWRPLWNQWHRWLEEQALTPLQASIGFPLAQHEVDRVVVGVDNRAQLESILESAKVPVVEPPSALASEDPELISPSLWSRD